MNAQRRKYLEKALGLLEEAKDIIDTCNQEESEYYENMPESLQNGEKGEFAQNAIDSMDNAISLLDDVVSELNDCI